MTTFPNSPLLPKGGLPLLDPESGAVQRIMALQHNPDPLTQSLQTAAYAPFLADVQEDGFSTLGRAPAPAPGGSI